jgi:hypothetical protein
MRWLLSLAIASGIAAGLVFPLPERGGANVTGRLYDAWYNISAGPSGQLAGFWCSWHTNCLVDRSGHALDFTHGSNRVEFRGGFKRSGPADFSLHTHQYGMPSSACHHEFRVDVHENHIEYSHGQHVPRWGMWYYHSVIRPGPGAFSIYHVSTGFGYYNSFYVGDMVWEDPTICSTTGTHVHDLMVMGPYPIGLPGYEPRADMFRVIDEGTSYQNNIHWTRHVQWGEGGQQP